MNGTNTANINLKLKIAGAEENVRKLRCLQNVCQDVKQNVVKLRRQVEECWQGAGGTAMILMLTEWISEQQNLIESMQVTADGLQKYIDSIEDRDKTLAEMMVIGITNIFQ